MLASWTSGPDRHLGSGTQFKIVSTLNVYRSRAGACTNHGTNRRTFTTARNRANDGAHCCTNGGTRDGLFGLVAFAYRTFIVNTNDVAIRLANRLREFRQTGMICRLST